MTPASIPFALKKALILYQRVSALLQRVIDTLEPRPSNIGLTQ